MIWKNPSSISLGVLLTGCAGYNHTLFMTKSNAGLDFDAKPPTAEISIARKEAVIAPTFEGGQTPPVLASFKPDVGAGSGFANFFLGVDQTFAGGDAAVAMAKLYGKPLPADGLADYDSSIVLSQSPKYTNIFQRLAAPGEVRPLIFGTDTLLGLKVAWSGVGGQMPDTVKAGFNRKEFAWAPLALSKRAADGSLRVKMPSFLATIDSRIGSDTNHPARISALQYFATGEAATRLALQPDVRAAMLARLDPNQEKFKTRFRSEQTALLTRVLVTVYDALGSLARQTPPDRAAQWHRENLNAVVPEFGVPDSFQAMQFSRYGYNMVAAPHILEKETVPPLAFTNSVEPFLNVTGYWQALNKSVNSLSQALSDLEAGTNIVFRVDDVDRSPISPDMKAAILREYKTQEAAFQEFDAKVRHNPAIRDAYGYFEALLTTP